VRPPLTFTRQFCLAAAAAIAAAVVALGACSEPLDNTLVPDDNQNASANGPSCLEDSDCVPAGPTCCSCPTYAVSTVDPVARACANVDCPVSECAENVIARCSERHRCELACAPRACEAAGAACPYGFAADANGCLTCECATPEPGGCTVDADCTRTRADCCGCLKGGFDTAVLVTERAGHDAMLMCSPTPACPGLSTCTSDVPTCVQGSCALVSPSLPAGACGRADLPACPAGTECLVNVNDQADMHGVGVCGTLP
jgi:hypothetical protein